MVIGLIIILLSIFVPYLLHVRETANRAACQDNLRKLAVALSGYAQANKGEFPRVVYDPARPHGYAAWTGPYAHSAFAPESAVQPSDVTASLWLLLRGPYIPKGYAPASRIFICPSSSNDADALRDDAGAPAAPERRSNFRSPENLSYSYASPFSDAAGYGLKSDFMPAEFVILADKNPGRKGEPIGPDASPQQLRKANSRNHGGEGQSVLYGDMHVEFRRTPYCGVGGDNIYSAVARSPIFTGQAPDMKTPGFVGPELSPAWQTDSYLVPTE